MYTQRYMPHLPAAGEIVIFDRSWYNRAGVERVMGFCTRGAGAEVPEVVPLVEKTMVESGHHPAQVLAGGEPRGADPAAEARIDDGRKIWKLSPMDLKSYSRWYDYSRARDEMFAATDTSWAPWFVVRSDDKRRARLNVIRHILKHVPHKDVAAEKIELPKRQSGATGSPITRSSTCRNESTETELPPHRTQARPRRGCRRPSPAPGIVRSPRAR